jgi:hypothetical protein
MGPGRDEEVESAVGGVVGRRVGECDK